MSAAVYTADELAPKAHCSTWLLYNTVKAGTCPFPFIKIGHRVLFPKAPADKILGIEPTPDDEVGT